MNETPESAHTPLRLSAGDETRIMDNNGFPLIDVKCGGMSGRRVKDAEEIAAFIVRACNSHYQLVDALESAGTLLTKAVGDIVAYRIMANKRPDPSATAEYVDAINAIDAALSQAGGASE